MQVKPFMKVATNRDYFIMNYTLLYVVCMYICVIYICKCVMYRYDNVHYSLLPLLFEVMVLSGETCLD